MKFDTPATTNPIDQLKVVGKPADRIDGPLKTTGTAPYAYERHDVVPNQAYGYVVGSAIAKGRIASMDLTAAKAAPGVLAIVTAENAGKLGKGKLQHREAARRPGDPALPPGDRASSSRRRSSRRAPPRSWSASTTSASEGAFDLAAVKDTAQARAASPAARPIPRSATSPAPSPRRRSSSTRPTPRPTRRTR